MRVHVDTDAGTNPDDVAALVMLLGAVDADLAGVTTVGDADGTRVAVARHVLAVAGRGDVEVTRGAHRTSTGVPVPPPRRVPVGARPSAAGAGDELGTQAARTLASAARTGATLVATGPLTNLATMPAVDPGALEHARVVVSGGWTGPHPPGLPQRGPNGDSNLARDTRAARVVFAAAGELTFVPLALTHRVALRRAHLPRLRAAGAPGRLLADLAVAHARDTGAAEVAAVHSGVPDDLVLFLHDPVACAVALGWDCVCTTSWRAALDTGDGGLVLRADPSGRHVRVATAVDAAPLVDAWLDTVERAGAGR